MAQPQASVPIASVLSNLKRLQREVAVGVTIGLTLFSASLAGGVVVATPLGPDHLAFGAAAAISGAVFGGACATLLSTSTFVMWGPIPTIALVQASLGVTLMSDPAFSRAPEVIVTALLICGALAGLLQFGVGVAGLASFVKYVPHPVVAGFINGVCATIFMSQVKLFFPFGQWVTEGPRVAHPAMLAFAVGLVAFVLWFGSQTKKVPAPLFGLLVGIIAYYALGFAAPWLDLGAILGHVPVNLPPIAPVASLTSPETRQMLIGAAPHIISVAFAIVLIGSLQTLLAFRMAENLAKTPISPDRGLCALGIADVVAAATGGLAISVGAPMSAAAFRSGGRTRIVGLSASFGLFLLAALVPNLLGKIPLAALVALLLVVSITNLDHWSLRLAWDIWNGRAKEEGPRVYFDIAVVLIVMGVTAIASITLGVIAGIAATCLIFVIDMSRPIVSHRFSGSNIRSKRVRTAAEATLLREYDTQHTVLQLAGVLFFGNAEALARELSAGFDGATKIFILDCRGVTNIDITGANIIRDIVESSGKVGKLLLFCNVPVARRSVIARIIGGSKHPAIFDDLDSALEWVENKLLREHGGIREKSDPLRLDEHDLIRGLDAAECGILAEVLRKREFAGGAALAVEGDQGDRMWLIMKGAVDIRLRAHCQRIGRRLASLGPGTTIGELSLIDGTLRSADAIAAEDVSCWELDRKSYDTIMERHPKIGAKLLTNFMRTTSRRLRNISEELREIEC
jgi:sulfate permease, SulP family